MTAPATEWATLTDALLAQEHRAYLATLLALRLLQRWRGIHECSQWYRYRVVGSQGYAVRG